MPHVPRDAWWIFTPGGKWEPAAESEALKVKSLIESGNPRFAGYRVASLDCGLVLAAVARMRRPVIVAHPSLKPHLLPMLPAIGDVLQIASGIRIIFSELAKPGTYLVIDQGAFDALHSVPPW